MLVSWPLSIIWQWQKFCCNYFDFKPQDDWTIVRAARWPGFSTLQASTRSRFSHISLTAFWALWCLLARPPILSFVTSRTRFKSPPIRISSPSKSWRWSKIDLKKAGSSSFGAYTFAKLMHFPFALKSHITAWFVDIGFHNLKVEVFVKKNTYSSFIAGERAEEAFVAPFRGP